ncbi:hypothetical protein AB3N61_12055 [Leptospira sp. WS58.C1]|uniref:outer membrane protein beta-barrel domain protein n=1 Tax=Leptospira TaxID=171 RepID=UPI0002BD7F24|nr:MULTISPECIES: outer membrane protein beta-barrel domain protein [unclassified Leptospira]EMJ97870.1 outer membrane protein beta-barrel domain protein [Leptospira sp. B5-022]MCR1795296.1 hypothetical protein [Leptospira sp. id769339]
MLSFRSFFYLFLYFIPVFLLAEPNPGQAEHPYGFYKGIFLLSGTTGNSFHTGGSIISREKEIQKNLKTETTSGQTPLRLLGQDVSPPLGLPNSQFSTPTSFRFFFEYGVTDKIGLGFAASSFSMDATNNREYLDLPRLSSSQPNPTYVEAFPYTKRFYNDVMYSLVVSFHPVSRSRVDPFINLEAGLVQYSTSSRNIHPSSVFEPITSTGTGYGARAGAGVNFFLTPEFGLQLEISGQKKWLKSDIIGNTTLESVQIQMGFLFNFENIAKYSER